MTGVCEQCGREFEKIAIHWSHSQTDCGYQSFTEHQREIITGLLMGDGYINRQDGKNPALMSKMISENYLRRVDNEMGIFGKGVSLYMTAEENAKKKRETGFSPDANGKNYSDQYRWYSMRHPELRQFENWYSTGEKVWPEDIELTPTVLKHWFCGDGCWNNNGSNNYIRIAMSNESENTEKVGRMFENVGLPSPNNYDTSERPSGGMRCSAQFTVEQSHKLWEYMGDPLPDFEYKWPEQYRNTFMPPLRR